MKIVILLPAYNEEKTVGKTIEMFHKVLPAASIWIIDNNSTDRTAYVSRKALASIKSNGGVLFESRQGKGNAIRRAFHDINADIYIMSDADLTYDPNDLKKMVELVKKKKADMVIGDRHSKGDYALKNIRPFHNFGNQLVRYMVNKLFKANLKDIMSGYRVFSRFFVKNYPILVDGFEIETDMTLHALDKKFRIIEVPTRYKNRPIGSFSKLDTISDGIRVIKTILNIFRHYKPFLFFSFISFSLAIVGFFIAIPVFVDWFNYKYIYRIPLAILATGIEITALIIFAIGLILDTTSYNEKKSFEVKLLNDTRSF